ncbi:MAG: hypothetical protein ACRDD2_10580 [Sarcina sp.]
MKKILAGLLSTLVLFIGCSSTKKLNTDEIFNSDFYNESESFITENENGYYFINGNYIYYTDKESMKAIVLCDKANCLHEKQEDNSKVYECNAFVYFSNYNYINIYNDEIYLTSSFNSNKKNEVLELIQLSSDGEKRKPIIKFDSDFIKSTIIDKGNIYYVNQKYKEDKLSTTIEKINLSNSKKEIIFTSTLTDGGIGGFTLNESKLYFYEYGHNDVNEFNEFDVVLNLETMDIKSEKVNYEKLKSPILIDNGKSLYSYFYGDKDERNSEIYSSDLDGNNEKLIYNIPHNKFLTDDKYIYAFIDETESDKGKLNIYDKKGSLLNSLELDFKVLNQHKGNSNYMFFKNISDFCEIKYIDKSKIGTTDLKIETLISVESKNAFKAISY